MCQRGELGRQTPQLGPRRVHEPERRVVHACHNQRLAGQRQGVRERMRASMPHLSYGAARSAQRALRCSNTKMRGGHVHALAHPHARAVLRRRRNCAAGTCTHACPHARVELPHRQNAWRTRACTHTPPRARAGCGVIETAPQTRACTRTHARDTAASFKICMHSHTRTRPLRLPR